MNRILVYSRINEKLLNSSIEIICEKLSEIGVHTEQTHSARLARMVLNSYQTVHLFVEKLPLTFNELIFISFAKTLGKATVLSIFNSDGKLSKPLISLFCPDALTVSQTNHLKFYRDWLCTKSLLPLIPKFKTNISAQSHFKTKQPYLVPLNQSLEEAFSYDLRCETFFDGRLLLATNTSTQLRKKWNHFLQLKKLTVNCHLILSDEKIESLLNEEKLRIVLADPVLQHTNFTLWLQKTLNRGHLILLNEFQATGFSQAWKSGENCEVLSTQNWPSSLIYYAETSSLAANSVSNFKNSVLIEPLINELSRLYTKILRSKTILLPANSAKIKS